MDPSTSAAALKAEIARLTGAINRRKTEETKQQAYSFNPARPRSNVYVNPNYKPPSKSGPPSRPTTVPPQVPAKVPPTTETKEVVIGGVAFQSSGRSLVRKELAAQKSTPSASSAAPAPRPTRPGVYARIHPRSTARPYKPKMSTRGRNMTLNNSRRPFQSRRVSKRNKVDKPCPRFTTTGACNRGLTCPYQHDPSKIAICWSFLQGNCPNTAETCNLSHDPTPERTPLCVHFANNGRCTRPNCPFPHVRVGQREGVCRDFAVLGYCEKGLDCDKQHVRECPDFAEKGACTTKGCKLPHVIRANRNRKPASSTSSDVKKDATDPAAASNANSGDAAGASTPHQATAEDAQLGDEFISLTFHESEDEDEDSEDEDEEDEEDGDAQEGSESHSDAPSHEDT
ncbi:hypothetical protein K474DRAFT_1771528 [Panus rudis PR-1116 ss-1]|nr:hypothetical protein K474DRAFT_1771528 [Panus rudis PR-1116 ss-1]